VQETVSHLLPEAVICRHLMPDSKFESPVPRSPSNGSVSGNATLGTRHRARFISNDPGRTDMHLQLSIRGRGLPCRCPTPAGGASIAGLRSNQSAVFVSKSERHFPSAIPSTSWAFEWKCVSS
jgi:hypothetical protein